MRKTSTAQILAVLLAASGMVSLVGCEATPKSTSTRENVSGTSQKEIANSESKSNLSEEQVESLENDFPQEAMVPTVNITVQMYPCSEGTDTGSPAL